MNVYLKFSCHYKNFQHPLLQSSMIIYYLIISHYYYYALVVKLNICKEIVMHFSGHCK